MSKLEVVVLKDRVLIGKSAYRVNWVQARPTGSKHYDGREVATFTVNVPTGQPVEETSRIVTWDNLGGKCYPYPTWLEGEPNSPVDRPKLSDLILAGALQHPQNFGWYWERDKQGNVLQTCAIGAAGWAAGIRPSALGAPETVREGLFALLGWSPADEPKIPYPENVEHCVFDFEVESNPEQVRILSVVMSLNDCARWSREAIAAYLKQFGF